MTVTVNWLQAVGLISRWFPVHLVGRKSQWEAFLLGGLRTRDSEVLLWYRTQLYWPQTLLQLWRRPALLVSGWLIFNKFRWQFVYSHWTLNFTRAAVTAHYYDQDCPFNINHILQISPGSALTHWIYLVISCFIGTGALFTACTITN